VRCAKRSPVREPALSDTLSVLLPDARDTELLCAALAPGPAGRDSWVRWREGVRDVRSALAERGPLLTHLLPLLRANTRRNGAEVDEEFRLAMAAATLQEERRTKSVFEILSDALEILKAAGIDVTVLKGTALAASVYPSKALRHCHDIDLLVPLNRLDYAEEALVQSGRYRSSEKDLSDLDRRVVHRSGLPLQLHGRLLRFTSDEKAEEAVLARRQAQRGCGQAFPILSPGDALWHVCGHAASSGNRGTLQWVADAWHLIERFAPADWNAFRTGVCEMDQALPAYVCLRYLSRTSSAKVPDSELRFVRSEARRVGRRARERALAGTLHGGRTGLHDLWAVTRSVRSRLFLVRWRVLPTRDYLATIYPRSSRLGLWALYPKRTLSCLLRPIRRAARRRRSGVLPLRPWMPTERQALLVRAALLAREPALNAWDHWKATGEVGCIDGGSSFLLPVLYRNLVDHGVSGPAVKRAQQAYKVTWLENERRFHEVAALLEVLNAAGIETMILKGAALALLYYRDLGLRSMGDVDILIRPHDVANAIGTLIELGWERTGPMPHALTETYLNARHGINLSNDRIAKLDLHWHVMGETCGPGEDDWFWSGAIRAAVRGVETHAMNPTDQLFHVCAHEARWTPTPLPRWIVDVMMILRASDDDIDWDRFISHTRRLGLVLPVREVLEQVVEVVDSPIPSSVLSDLRRLPLSKEDERKYRSQCLPPSLLRALTEEYRRMAMQPGRHDRRWRILTFPSYARALWGLDHGWQVPIQGVLWGARTLRRSARYHAGKLTAREVHRF